MLNLLWQLFSLPFGPWAAATQGRLSSASPAVVLCRTGSGLPSPASSGSKALCWPLPDLHHCCSRDPAQGDWISLPLSVCSENVVCSGMKRRGLHPVLVTAVQSWEAVGATQPGSCLQCPHTQPVPSALTEQISRSQWIPGIVTPTSSLSPSSLSLGESPTLSGPPAPSAQSGSKLSLSLPLPS